VTQRLRWIPPGRFFLGSPVSEEERSDWEFLPQAAHFDSGFWIFDTPCTQALWEAVMRENTSRFKGPDHPAERVSWDDCQIFLERLNEQLEGLVLGLPSETQWEYACRAGTTTARYRDDVGLIAWYGRNTGVGTHPVGQKIPNDWGLYDMLGNVWEWCADRWRDPTESDAPESGEASAGRVARGGSWSDVPRGVRAACRSYIEPTMRGLNLGFRCAEFRGGS
jgi:formylglycine-generating enzyme required for sulfatase activity